ncbi:NirD/YgiW/YdeI family stress tolerance protein [Glaesserella parasuis]|uniref:OB-fold nucleic acid binding domain-containing protein n=4 Tax=Glaesserella parasuis TaxID=738 RepID=B8F860_GLAP5|nr:NirD/YgiW/YdeI family stress tolerance protein [Glaesserella parasuis]AGO16870.1 OB-fold nucleic acid binding domain-containing protein [Glaesserella parasuis ZJ0906]ACL33512.1 OB-fold nucleic acid binding domain-containing protein [Glaesserella parasuis SH0165]AIK17664.1 hypothetical protein JL26_07655 [Glaesserella parasuis]AIK90121.1 hypothetical protein JT17_04915 [Glaesserella parasuis]AWY46225.1 TIGR00156 family protein [Glaesserella parasuis 29755]
MKKLTLLSALLLSTVSLSAFADKGYYQNGGFTNSQQAVTQASQVSSMSDDQYVVLQGKLVKQLDKDNFTFRDASGEITVDIDDDAWRGLNVTPNDEIRLYGEIDKSLVGTEVDVHRVEKVN